MAARKLRSAPLALGHKRLETTAKHYVLDELVTGLTDGLYQQRRDGLKRVSNPLHLWAQEDNPAKTTSRGGLH